MPHYILRSWSSEQISMSLMPEECATKSRKVPGCGNLSQFRLMRYQLDPNIDRPRCLSIPDVVSGIINVLSEVVRQHKTLHESYTWCDAHPADARLGNVIHRCLIGYIMQTKYALAP
jgi:hypothetical protein